MNARDNIPNTIKAMALPVKPFGRLENFDIFCLSPARRMMAIIQPSDDPNENAAVSTKL